MKDAMTDHKAEWVDELQHMRAVVGCNPSANGKRWAVRLAALDAAIAALTAAPAASEGEDGAVLWVSPEDFRNPYFIGMNAVRAGHEQYGKHYTMPLYTRPAAQVAATPKHDACETCNGHGLIDTSSGQTPDTYQPDAMTCEDCDGTGKATPKHDEGREAAERVLSEYVRICVEEHDERSTREDRIEAMRRALATQPAARRVTVDDAMVERAIDEMFRFDGNLRNAVFIATGQSAACDAAERAWRNVYDAEIHGDGSRTDNRESAMRAALEAALESFAQPAEGDR